MNGNRCRDSQSNIKESCRRVENKTKAGGDKDITRRPTESTNLGPWRLTETEPPTKKAYRSSLCVDDILEIACSHVNLFPFLYL